ncbi:MAG: hypothetical protein V7676_03005 [Parasphingorhabdus sp.]|uniref:hypothetical protein n=1 Tax=Parasphingorhabdus sp. TaxID=2709688 RepID=UPI003002962A
MIAASLKGSGNDELYLGNHDANLIFRYKKELSFSLQEIRALVDCGIVGFHHQNVPLWRWLVDLGMKEELFKRIKVLAIVGDTEVQGNAIRLLQIIGEPVPQFDENFTRETIVTRWLDADDNNQAFSAAAEFLSHNGAEDEIEIIEKISAGYPPHRKAKLDTIVATIKARFSREEALKYICSQGVDKVIESSVEMIFSTPSALSTDILAECLSAKPDTIRLKATKLLIERGELTEAAAQILLSDSNHEIRLLAVEGLQNGEFPVAFETVKTILTIQKATFGLGLLQAAKTDETYYDRYLENRMGEKDFDQLKQLVAEAGVFNEKELFAFYGKFSRRLSDDIRANLRDQFASMFEEKVKQAEAIPGIKDDYRTKVYQLWDFYQKKLCSRAIAVLCGLKIKSDIGLIRATLDSTEIDLSPELLAYLANFGDWSDVGRIERLTSSSKGNRGLLDFSYNIFAEEKAAAIFKLGKHRIADLLNADMSAPIRKALTKLYPKSIFRNLSNDAIIAELDKKDDEYRIIFTLKCIESLPKKRIETILNQYIDRDTQRYYNCVHWLDLGASLPKKQANAIVCREMFRRSH